MANIDKINLLVVFGIVLQNFSLLFITFQILASVYGPHEPSRNFRNEVIKSNYFSILYL